jgi:hypothetical protein
MTMQTKVLIADDRRPSNSGRRVVLAVRPEIVIVGEVADGQEAVRLVAGPSWSSDVRRRNCWGRSWTVRVDDPATHRKKREEQR